MICDLKKRMCTPGLSSVWWIKNTLCKKGTLYFWMGLKSCDPNQFHEKHAHFPALFFCQLVMYTRVVPTTLQPSGSQALTFFPKVPSFWRGCLQAKARKTLCQSRANLCLISKGLGISCLFSKGSVTPCLFCKGSSRDILAGCAGVPFWLLALEELADSDPRLTYPLLVLCFCFGVLWSCNPPFTTTSR